MYISNMDLNLKIDYASPMMLVLVCLGVMLAMNAILPMIPSLPVLDNLRDGSNSTKMNVVNSLFFMAMVVYVGSLVHNILKL